MIDLPSVPPIYLEVLWKLAISVLILVLTWIANRAVNRVLRRRIRDEAQRQTLWMLVRNTIIIVGIAIVISIWFGFSSSFTVAMGILGAGIAFASQELIGSLAGYLNIVTGSLYHIGDRIRLGSVSGDVLDINLMRTTIMEIGEWVGADQYTGRIVDVANRIVFSEPVINYTEAFPYIWDEIMIPITYQSDWQRATEIMMAHGEEYSESVQGPARATFDETRRRYPALQETQVEPSLYTVMTDNWVELTLRYIVDPRERRGVKAALHRDLLQHFAEETTITVASATFEIVGFPPLKSDRDGMSEVDEIASL
jgi:small-conductance mechanosensitive channel